MNIINVHIANTKIYQIDTAKKNEFSKYSWKLISYQIVKIPLIKKFVFVFNFIEDISHQLRLKWKMNEREKNTKKVMVITTIIWRVFVFIITATHEYHTNSCQLVCVCVWTWTRFEICSCLSIQWLVTIDYLVLNKRVHAIEPFSVREQAIELKRVWYSILLCLQFTISRCVIFFLCLLFQFGSVA